MDKTSPTHDRLAQYREPIELPESVKAEARFGWGLIAIIVAVVATFISITTKYVNDLKNIVENSVISQTDFPGQFSVVLPDMSSPALIVFFALTTLALIVFTIPGSVYTGIDAALVVGSIVVVVVLGLITISSFDTIHNYLKSDAPLTHLSEVAGTEFIGSNYNKDNSILTVDDGATAYNFLATSSENGDGQKVVYLTLQQ